jgi:hypothetical protein
MTHSLDKILNELRNNKTISDNTLVKMLVNSFDKSIKLNENVHIAYTNLKDGLFSINKNLKNDTLSALIGQIKKSETTPEAIIERLGKQANITSKLNSIKKSIVYSNPLIKNAVDVFSKKVDEGFPDFILCPEFINIFEQYSYDKTIAKAITNIKKYINVNEAKLRMLYTIYEMESVNSPVYSGVCSSLKEMLINEEYTADILKLKYGNSMPLISNLVNNLRIIESRENNSFTLGEGNGDTQVNNLIAPMAKLKNGLLIFTDNRFLSIREAKGLHGNESKIHIDSNFKISETKPSWVQEKFPKFYSVCEAYAGLEFKKTQDGLGVESKSVRNITIGLKLNESNTLDLYLNNNKITSINEAKNDIAKVTALQTTQNKVRINRVLENASKIFNFEFIKELQNDRTNKSALIAKLNNDYFICEKLNPVEQSWKKASIHTLYTYVLENFQYDIRPIFNERISKSEETISKIEKRKKQILSEVDKLEESVTKLTEACKNPELDQPGFRKLEAIKESIETAIKSLKNDYVNLDLQRKNTLTSS